MEQGRAERHAKFHLVMLAQRSDIGMRESTFHASAALSHERQMLPERYRSRSQGDADRDVVLVSEGPVQGKADVVELASVIADPLGRWPGVPFRLRLRCQVQHVLGVASSKSVAFAGFGQLLESVAASRVEETIMRRCPPRVHGQEGLGDETCQAFNQIGPVQISIGSQGTGGFETEGSREDRKASQDHAFALGQEVMAPVQRGGQGLMASRSITPPLEHTEPVIEEGKDLADLEGVDACRSEFDGQRHAVELAANLGDGRRVCVIQGERIEGCSGAFHEKFDGRKGQSLRGHKLVRVRRGLQGRKAINHLAFRTKRLPASRKNADPGGSREDVPHTDRRCVDDVLAIVENEHEPSVAQEHPQCRPLIGRMHGETDCGRNRTRHQS